MSTDPQIALSWTEADIGRAIERQRQEARDLYEQLQQAKARGASDDEIARLERRLEMARDFGD